MPILVLGLKHKAAEPQGEELALFCTSSDFVKVNAIMLIARANFSPSQQNPILSEISSHRAYCWQAILYTRSFSSVD